MLQDHDQTLRLHEWAGISIHNWDSERRARLVHTVTAWKNANRLNVAPLSLGGDGNSLQARQFVGVVEAADAAIEIYPKLDAGLLDDATSFSENRVRSVMHNLLWMLEVTEHHDIAETETAGLEETPDTFVDLFAFLLAKRLLRELENGVAHTYQRMEDDLRAVRGRIQILDQVTRNWNRLDRMACAWDEFTSDTLLNRLFKCACRFLHQRVGHTKTSGLLADCLALLEDVADVPVEVALFEIQFLRWDRSNERFRLAFNLARRLMEGTGHALGAGEADTFVFLLDMNAVFEDYAHAVLEKYFDTGVETQKFLGRLFNLSKGGINQYADYYWEGIETTWIGDAKYKHLTKGRQDSLKFAEAVDDTKDEEQGEELSTATNQAAGRLITPSDVRQLTVYAELEKKRNPSKAEPSLMLLYPFVGSGRFEADSTTTWNGSTFWLMPVRVDVQRDLREALPAPSSHSPLAEMNLNRDLSHLFDG